MMAEADNAALQAQVSRSSFYAAMRIMPKAEREAMFAIYRFCWSTTSPKTHAGAAAARR